MAKWCQIVVVTTAHYGLSNGCNSDDLQLRSRLFATASLLHVFSYCYAAVYKRSTDSASRGPCAVAELIVLPAKAREYVLPVLVCVPVGL